MEIKPQRVRKQSPYRNKNKKTILANVGLTFTVDYLFWDNLKLCDRIVGPWQWTSGFHKQRNVYWRVYHSQGLCYMDLLILTTQTLKGSSIYTGHCTCDACQLDNSFAYPYLTKSFCKGLASPWRAKMIQFHPFFPPTPYVKPYCHSDGTKRLVRFNKRFPRSFCKAIWLREVRIVMCPV